MFWWFGSVVMFVSDMLCVVMCEDEDVSMVI